MYSTKASGDSTLVPFVFLVGLLYYNTKIKWKNFLSHIHFYCVQIFLQYGMSNFCAPL